MTLPLVVIPEAEADVAAAQAYYEAQRPGLGARFVAAVDATLQVIQAMPQLYAVVARRARQAQVRRFRRYYVLYRVETDRIEVLAVMHTSRDPGEWQARL